MSVALEKFVSSVRASGLVPAAELDALLGKLPPDTAERAQDLAKALVREGKLTRFQAIEVYQGRAARLLLGNYVLLDSLGGGGMGLVFKAQHRRMKRIVALKTLPPELAKNPERIQRFQREVEAAARLNHPNIVTAYDADDAGGVHFLVMEYVEGSDLAKYIRRCGQLSQRKAVEYIVQAARGLEYAHEQGVIHRDIKPGNLLLDSKGTIRVLDMGLARFEQGDAEQLASLSGDDLSHTGRVMGTLDYLAPEQAIDSKHVDRRADIYSLGCTLYFLLLGRTPAPEASLPEKLLWHQSGEIPSLRAVRADVQADLDAVFCRMLARKPADRLQSMTEVIAQLEACLASLSQDSEATLDLPGSHAEQARSDDFVIPELVDESPPPLPLPAAETNRSQLPPPRTIIESRPPRPARSSARAKEQQIQRVAIGVVAVGCLVGLALWWLGRNNQPASEGPIVWNEQVKSLVGDMLVNGFDSDVGRNLYSDIVTALDESREGDWRVGRGLTKDLEAYHLRVAGGKVSSRKMSAREVDDANLQPGSTQRSVDNSFRMPVHEVVSLEDAQLRLEAIAGKQRVRGSVFCVLSGQEPADNVTLVLRNRSTEGVRTVTRDFYQQLPWSGLSSRRVDVEFEFSGDPFAADSQSELFLQAFLFRPMPRYYRISNELPCVVQVVADTAAESQSSFP